MFLSLPGFALCYYKVRYFETQLHERILRDIVLNDDNEITNVAAHHFQYGTPGIHCILIKLEIVHFKGIILLVLNLTKLSQC